MCPKVTIIEKCAALNSCKIHKIDQNLKNKNLNKKSVYDSDLIESKNIGHSSYFLKYFHDPLLDKKTILIKNKKALKSFYVS